MFTRKTVLILMATIITATTFSCHKAQLPDDVLTEKQMVDLLVELHTIDAFFNVTNGFYCDTLSEEIGYTYQQTFKKHGITREEFKKSLDYYSKDTKKHREIYEKVVLKLNKTDK